MEPLKGFTVDSSGKKRTVQEVEAFITARRKQEDLALKSLREQEATETKERLKRQKQENDMKMAAIQAEATLAKTAYANYKLEVIAKRADADKAQAEAKTATAEAETATSKKEKAVADAEKAAAEAEKARAAADKKKDKKEKKEKKEKR